MEMTTSDLGYPYTDTHNLSLTGCDGIWKMVVDVNEKGSCENINIDVNNACKEYEYSCYSVRVEK